MMDKFCKFDQEADDVIMDKLFERLTTPDQQSADGRIFPNENKSYIPTEVHQQNFVLNNCEIDNEIDLVPDVFNNEFDLFYDYCLNLKKHDHTEKIVQNIERYFAKNNYTMNGCNLSGHSPIINQTALLTNLEINEFPKNKQVSNKIRFCHYSAQVVKTIAVADIIEGETIICEKALVEVKAPNCICVNTSNYECNNCWKPIRSFHTCSICRLAIYCSLTCRAEAFNYYHRWECHAQKAHFLGIGNLGHLALRMLFFGVKYKFNTKLSKKYKELYNLSYDLRLLSKDDMKMLLHRTMQLMIYLSKYTDFFQYLYIMGIMKGKTVMEKFLHYGGLLVRHYAQTLIHSFYLPLEDYSFVTETRGMEYYNPCICLNTGNIRHSCIPNAFLNFRRNYCIVKASRDIKCGEEILLNFNGLDRFCTIGDKINMLKTKQIKCNCLICAKERLWNYTGQLFKCPKCKGPMGRLSEQWKCFKCIYNEKNLEMDVKCIQMQNFEQFPVYSDPNIILTFLNQCELFLQTQMKYYYSVFVTLISFYLSKDQISCAVFFARSLMHRMNLSLHRFSLMRILVLTAVINYIFIYAVTRRCHCAKSLVECCELMMRELQTASAHYNYTHQMKHLQMVFNKIFRSASGSKFNFRFQIAVDDSDDSDCNNDDCDQTSDIQAAYALLALSKSQ